MSLRQARLDWRAPVGAEGKEQTRRSNARKASQTRSRKRRDRSPELAEDGVEALDDFMRSNRFNAIQGND